MAADARLITGKPYECARGHVRAVLASVEHKVPPTQTIKMIAFSYTSNEIRMGEYPHTHTAPASSD
jgi:predicted RNA-binding protein associated with RNAse of E/G family